MAEVDLKRRTDGFITVEGGVDSGRSATLLQKNQLAWAENVTMRGGFAKPRLVYHQIMDGGIIPAGRFQHAAFFNGVTRPQLMCVVGGKPQAISCDDFSIRDVSIPGDPNLAMKLLGWSVTAEKWWLYQDNDSKCLIYDGASSRRAEAKAYEVPVGNVMEYAFGRVVVALKNGTSFRIGDLVYGPSGTEINENRDSVLKFTETLFANEGGDFIERRFGGPSNAGKITAMRQSVVLNTALGQGPMIVGTDNTIFSINLPFDRTTWKDINSVLQSVAMVGHGPTSQSATTIVNGDIFYRGPGGVYSHFLSVRNFGQWGNTAQSTEVNRSLTKDPAWLLQFGSSVNFDNRMLITARPTITDYGIYHDELLSLDFDLISSLTTKLNPVWEGSWTGLKILQLVFGEVDKIERCFAFVLNDDNRIELWEILKQGTTDDGERIPFTLETPRYAFSTANQFGIAQPRSFGANRLDGAQLFLENCEGQIDGILTYRSDGAGPWQPWATFSFCAKICDDEVPGPPACTPPGNLLPQSRVKIRFPTPPDVDDVPNAKLTRVGFDFQARLQITGYCNVASFRLNAYDEQEFPYYEIGSTACVRLEGCDAPP